MPGPSQWLTDTVTAAVTWCTHRPWLAGVSAAVLIAVHIARAVLARWRHRMMVRHATCVTITPPPEVDPAGTAAFWATMAEILHTGWRRRLRDGRSHIAVEYRWTGRQLTIAVWVPGTLQTGPIQAAIRGAWPGAACTVTDAAPPLPLDAVTIGGALAPTLPPWYPLETDHDNDPMRTLIAAASNLHSAESACVQLLARPAAARQIRRLRHGVQALRTGKPPWALLGVARHTCRPLWRERVTTRRCCRVDQPGCGTTAAGQIGSASGTQPQRASAGRADGPGGGGRAAFPAIAGATQPGRRRAACAGDQ